MLPKNVWNGWRPDRDRIMSEEKRNPARIEIMDESDLDEVVQIEASSEMDLLVKAILHGGDQESLLPLFHPQDPGWRQRFPPGIYLFSHGGGRIRTP